MPVDARHRLAATASAMWGKYESACRTGGTPEQRSFACDQAVKADDALAAHDYRAQEKRRQRMAARALSGA